MDEKVLSNMTERLVCADFGYRKIHVDNEKAAKAKLQDMLGTECYKHRRKGIISYFNELEEHVADYCPESKTLTMRDSNALRQSSERFDGPYVSRELVRIMDVARTAARWQEVYPEVRGWAKMEFENQVEYARGAGEKGLSVVIDKTDGDWTLSIGSSFRTIDAGRNTNPKKVIKLLLDITKLYR